MRVEGVVVELHAAGDRDRHSEIEMFNQKEQFREECLFLQGDFSSAKAKALRV